MSPSSEYSPHQLVLPYTGPFVMFYAGHSLWAAMYSSTYSQETACGLEVYTSCDNILGNIRSNAVNLSNAQIPKNVVTIVKL